MRKVGVLLLSLMMVFSLVSCGKLADKLADKTAEEIITKVQETMEGLKSYTGVSTTNMSMSWQGDEMKVVSKSDMTVFTNPLKTRVETTTEMSPNTAGKSEITIYIEHKDGFYYMYFPDGSGGYSVQKMTDEEFKEVTKTLGGTESASHYLGVLSSLEKAEELETIDGVECVKITAQITGDTMADILDAAGLSQAFAGMLSSEVLKDLEPVKITYWFDNAKAYIVKSEIDMKDMMSALIDTAFAGEGVNASTMMSFSELNSVMTFANFNAAEKFDMPEETKEADTTQETSGTEASVTPDE